MQPKLIICCRWIETEHKVFVINKLKHSILSAERFSVLNSEQVRLNEKKLTSGTSIALIEETYEG